MAFIIVVKTLTLFFSIGSAIGQQYWSDEWFCPGGRPIPAPPNGGRGYRVNGGGELLSCPMGHQGAYGEALIRRQNQGQIVRPDLLE
jgi:hypothetical protein